jgi:hypothetical protein
MKTRVINVNGNVSLACQNPNAKLVVNEDTRVGMQFNPTQKLHVSGTKERRSTYKYYLLCKLKQLTTTNFGW